MLKSLPQNVNNNEMIEAQKNQHIRHCIETLMKRGFSKEAVKEHIKQNYPDCQFLTKPSTSKSNTDSSNKTTNNVKAEEIIKGKSEDNNNRSVTTNAVATPQVNDAFSNSFRSSSSASDEEHLNKTDDDGQSTDSTKEIHTQDAPKKLKAKILNVGILHYKYPDDLLSNEQVNLIKEAILKNIEQQANKTIKPKFLNSKLERGWLLLTCADIATVKWIKGLCLKPWANANLIVKNEKMIPLTECIFMGTFPNSPDPDERILKYLRAQNEGLNTAIWKVHSKIENQNNINITFIIDKKSVKQLKNNGNEVFYKLNTLQLLPKLNNSIKIQIPHA